MATPLDKLGVQGIFTQALERGLVEGTIDAAVHSAKDLPSRLGAQFQLAAFPVREDPRDCIVTASGLSFDRLPRGASVGTGSPRRVAQLRSIRPDLEYVPIRGNVDTRRAAALSGRVAAVVLAMAGLARLNLLDQHVVPLPVGTCLPQAGQGALAVETRADDADMVAIVAAIDDRLTRCCVEAERAVLVGLKAGCQAPVAAFATVSGAGRMTLRAGVGSAEGRGPPISVELMGDATSASDLGLAAAEDLIARGAERLLRA